MDYIDIHCHLNFPEYDSDRDEVIARAHSEGIRIINVGTDIPMSKKAIELAENHQNMWATVAIHPNHTKDSFDYEELRKLIQHPKVVAIGECGLDYFHSEPEDRERQREVFLQHINLANEIHKPLMLHVRNGKEDKGVYQEALDMLRKYAKVRSNFHFFAGSIDDAKAILDIGGTMSFTGVVTFTHDYNEVIKYIPSGSLMSETDAPYVAPVPYRGKRNEPTYIKEVVARLAEIRGEQLETLKSDIFDTTKKMFGI